ITLQRNPRYWDVDAVKLTQVNYLTIEDHSSEYKLYQAGELDMTRGVPAGSFPRLKVERPAELKSIPSLSLRYFSLNNSDALLADKRVRQALSMVIDRDILVERILADGQIPAYSVLIDGIAGARVVPYDWAQWPMARKIELARSLLAQAGVRPGTRVKISYNTNDVHKKVALFLAAEWKQKLGIETSLENMEFRVLLRERNAGNFQIARDGWVADYRDATSMLTIVRCRSAQNSNKNCSEEAETLLMQAQQAPDDATRADLQTRAAALIMQDYPMVPLSQGTQAHLVKPYVAGYGESNPIGRQRSRYLTILPH
ncbi:MAG: peptide ABC transporter substrate-binding protein, partial [Comamonadaceae bacterium]